MIPSPRCLELEPRWGVRVVNWQVSLVLGASWGRRMAVRVGVFPCLKQLLRLIQQCPLFPAIRDVAVRFEERADIEGLAAPQVSVDSPVERQLERAAIERQCGLSVRHV
jgi:hypothetical protein